jgi:hypothetical protein
MSANLARRLETALAAVVASARPGTNVYRQGEGTQRLLPCVVISARTQGIDYSVKHPTEGNAALLDLRVHCIVDATDPASAEDLEIFAQQVRDFIESATMPAGWFYLRLEAGGEERVTTETTRTLTWIWGGAVL